MTSLNKTHSRFMSDDERQKLLSLAQRGLQETRHRGFCLLEDGQLKYFPVNRALALKLPLKFRVLLKDYNPQKEMLLVGDRRLSDQTSILLISGAFFERANQVAKNPRKRKPAPDKQVA